MYTVQYKEDTMERERQLKIMERIRVLDIAFGDMAFGEIEKENREEAFVDSLKSDSVVLEFPRRVYDSFQRYDFQATREYLEEFTNMQPQYNFMLFESYRPDEDNASAHLVRAELPQNINKAELKSYLEEFIRDLYDNPRNNLDLRGRRGHCYRLIHNGETFHVLETGDPNSIEFDGVFRDEKGKVLVP